MNVFNPLIRNSCHVILCFVHREHCEGGRKGEREREIGEEEAERRLHQIVGASAL